MADTVPITAGSGTSIATDDRSSVHFQEVVPVSTTTIATGQVTPTSTAATLIAARDRRHRVIFTNRSEHTVYIGPATVSASNGHSLLPGDSIPLYTTALVQVINDGGTTVGKVHYIEEYDA
jgi:hypothetical protein